MTMRTRVSNVAIAVALALAVCRSAIAAETAKVVVTPRADLKWTESGIPGVSAAVVEGDMGKGPSRFYLKYAAGFVAPIHHHSPDHYVTTLVGNFVLVVDGKEHRLPAGSYFAFTGKAKHAARCEGSEACVMFIDARGAWDVVPDSKPDAKQ